MALWLATLQIMLDKGQEVDWFGALWLRWFAGISVVSFVCFIIRELCAQLSDRQLAHAQEPQLCRGVRCVFDVRRGALRAGDDAAAVSPNASGLYGAGRRVDGQPARRGCAGGAWDLSACCHRGSTCGFLIAFGFAVLGASCFILSRLSLDVAMRQHCARQHADGIWHGLHFCAIDDA